ncbi:hypothetical protein HDV57DRAFT_392329 [Trichoderma longibrachiatum]|uniref:Uncharacterized protein n=1 Tax=Trichoderma longibrachiatum ATCC 18648 TaxID=983965 RepID=A0A2T4C3J2_TRILO|nr:hypothetical protein M440DRAFT_314760 [Trichoderma longibrachiatum ATCC 18648]
MTFFFLAAKGNPFFFFSAASAGAGNSSCGIVSHRPLAVLAQLRAVARPFPLSSYRRCFLREDTTADARAAKPQPMAPYIRCCCGIAMRPPSVEAYLCGRWFGAYHGACLPVIRKLQLMGAGQHRDLGNKQLGKHQRRNRLNWNWTWREGCSNLNLPHCQEPQHAHLGGGPLAAPAGRYF